MPPFACFTSFNVPIPLVLPLLARINSLPLVDKSALVATTSPIKLCFPDLELSQHSIFINYYGLSLYNKSSDISIAFQVGLRLSLM